MFTLNFAFINDNDELITKRVSSYELSMFLKSYPDDGYSSILERVWTKLGMVKDYYNEEEEAWYPGFFMPPTKWLVRRIQAEYGQGPIWIKVPASLLGLLESVRQPPKRRWRLSGKWRKINNKYHRPWWRF